MQRVKLGRSIATTKNGIIAYLKREYLFDLIPKTNGTFSKKRMAAMNTIKFGNQKDLVLRTMLEWLSFYEQQAFTLDQEIRKNAKISGSVKLLISIPGIDFNFASLLSSFIGDKKMCSRTRTNWLHSLALFLQTWILDSFFKEATCLRRVHVQQNGHCLLLSIP